MKLHALNCWAISPACLPGFSEKDIHVETHHCSLSMLLHPLQLTLPLDPCVTIFSYGVSKIFITRNLDKLSFLKFSFETRTHYYEAKAGFVE